MRNSRRKLLSQNFRHNLRLVRKLVGLSSVGENDLIVEIGPGKGIITQELLQKAENVIAVEIDTHWCQYLRHIITDENFILYQQDFLSFRLPKLPYKVFANIPFAIEGKVIRKLLEDNNPPEDCYLVIMEELGNRLSAQRKENMFSIMHKPWFEFAVLHHFQPSDFSPRPNVHAVLFRFQKKRPPLLSAELKKKYWNFVQLGFTNGQPVFKNFQRRYPKRKLEKVFQQLLISKKATPRQLSLKKWVKLYTFLTSDASQRLSRGKARR